VTLLFDAVEAFFVDVLLVSDEAGIFAGPSGVGRPLVIENGVAEFVSTAAGLLAFL
jgi:hypothetical protein